MNVHSIKLRNAAKANGFERTRLVTHGSADSAANNLKEGYIGKWRKFNIKNEDCK